MNETGRARAGIGIPSFLMIVTTLALTVLGVLCINDAQADAALQQRHEVLTAAYYEATAQAQRMLAQADEAFAQAFVDSTDEADYAYQCAQIKRIGEEKLTWLDETHAVFYTDAGYGRRLRVEIQLNGFEDAGKSRFAAVRQTLEDATEWDDAVALPLIAEYQASVHAWA